MYIKKNISTLLLLIFAFSIQSCKSQEKTVTPTITPPKSVTGVRGVWLTNVGSQALYSKEGIKQAVEL